MNNEPDYNDNLYFEKLQKSKNVANNVTNENLQDLTEQWKKGEFIVCNAGRCQYYYVQNEKQQEVIKTEYCLFDDNTPHWKILAPVPSYEELKQLKDLLKECRRDLIIAEEDCGWDRSELIQQIDEVLK